MEVEMFKDVDEWLHAIRNSSMNSKRQAKLAKEVLDGSQYFQRKDKDNQQKDCGVERERTVAHTVKRLG
jgi:hypothetical protein